MTRPPSLLIVDDETSVLLTLSLIFEEVGYAVSTARSCAEAIAMIRHSGSFDAVITDMCMEQDQSGFEVVMAATQLRPRPAIVVITGFGTLETMKTLVGSSVDYVALKPLDVDELKHVVARLLALRSDRLGKRPEAQT